MEDYLIQQIGLRLSQEFSDELYIDEIWGDKYSITFKGKFKIPDAEAIERIKDKLQGTGYIPIFQIDNNKIIVKIRTALESNEKEKWFLNLLLFIATIMTTLLAGSFYEGKDPFINFKNIIFGIPFSLSIITILGAHELGHYFFARIHKVRTTLPYFIPFPFSLVGTLGAVIKIKSPMTNKRALLDIGSAGPIAGMIFAIPIVIIGFLTSQVKPFPPGPHLPGSEMGSSLLLEMIQRLLLPPIPDGYAVYLNSVGFAGWIGFLVTMLNLIPIGQLDGGHIAYALLGKKHNIVAQIFIIVLLILSLFFYVGWLVWAMLIFFVIKLNHPAPLDDITPLDNKRKIIGIVVFIIFILTFIPNPFVGTSGLDIITGKVNLF